MPVRDDDAAHPAASRHAAAHAAHRWRSAKRPFIPTPTQTRATKAILVRLANWLRCRKLAKASPGDAWLTHGLRAAAAPKYCNRPITLLTRPANNQACAAGHAQRCENDASPAASLRVPREDATKIKPAVAASATSQGTTAGDGTGAKGFSQGTVNAHPANKAKKLCRMWHRVKAASVRVIGGTGLVPVCPNCP